MEQAQWVWDDKIYMKVSVKKVGRDQNNELEFGPKKIYEHKWKQNKAAVNNSLVGIPYKTFWLLKASTWVKKDLKVA